MGLRDQFHEKARQLAERAGAEAREARDDAPEGAARRAPDAPGTPGRAARQRPAEVVDDTSGT
ncbi:hypothetical protein AB0P12_05765 [Streptomyces subrutilus]|uniref:Uncharacterized protein n=1 Tax=Streptomyces subrutilus TaxID=36818 RepID=A0A918V063_9ACTN|nr:hypothetical protein [Streptomyces subrutilus]GGZ49274.1 hypothetical protein GCM10010371_05720 [Streptomyces subrutilus]